MNTKTSLFIMVSSLIMNIFSAKIHAEENSSYKKEKKPVQINIFFANGKINSYVMSNNDSKQKTTINDTVRITGVLIQPEHMQKKYLYATNKSGKDYIIKHEISPANRPGDIIMYTERGDIIIIKDNQIIKNLTMERLKNEFVKGR